MFETLTCSSGLNTVRVKRSVAVQFSSRIAGLRMALYLCKDELKRQVKSTIDSMEQKASILNLIRLKSEELDALKLESMRLHDRNVALTKELVSLKLVSDVNLEEDEVLKPASFGNEANNKDTVDIIRKSVVILIISGLAQMIVLLPSSDKGRRIDMVIEVKDNETLRALKAPKKTKCKGIVTECIKDNFNALSTSVSSIDSDSKHQTREAVNSTLAKSETVSYIHSEAKVHKTDAKENSLSSKKCKYEAKTSSLQSQGSLQIEHFFGEPVSNQRKVVHKAIATHLDSVNGIMNLELGTKRLLHLSYKSVKPGAYNDHKYMHGSTAGLSISKVNGLLKLPWFQPIGFRRAVLIKTLSPNPDAIDGPSKSYERNGQESTFLLGGVAKRPILQPSCLRDTVEAIIY
ncbi:hypothetical protein D5086_005011 [Populus alba]|uniref:Uncharacterized protein n=1 Tax=Populus alba TaxID=43335 RepID=A0ACC4CSS9_POPAL